MKNKPGAEQAHNRTQKGISEALVRCYPIRSYDFAKNECEKGEKLRNVMFHVPQFVFPRLSILRQAAFLQISSKGSWPASLNSKHPIPDQLRWKEWCLGNANLSLCWRERCILCIVLTANTGQDERPESAARLVPALREQWWRFDVLERTTLEPATKHLIRKMSEVSVAVSFGCNCCRGTESLSIRDWIPKGILRHAESFWIKITVVVVKACSKTAWARKGGSYVKCAERLTYRSIPCHHFWQVKVEYTSYMIICVCNLCTHSCMYNDRHAGLATRNIADLCQVFRIQWNMGVCEPTANFGYRFPGWIILEWQVPDSRRPFHAWILHLRNF